jgi:hypothetical protein
VFEAISKVQPKTLFLVADGPRLDRDGEADACRLVRDLVSRVDWPCEVVKNFSDSNLGCGERMISGLNWVFSQAEEAIILEDDCLPDPSFFPFCEELLEKYRGDSRVAYISGNNLVPEYKQFPCSYGFSRIGGIWGWATWRSEWNRYDRHLSTWPEFKRQGMLAEIFGDPVPVKFFTQIFDAMYEKKGPDTWDYQWLYTNFKNSSFSVIPRGNLVTNIGFGRDATHTIGVDVRFIIPPAPMSFPMKHPSGVIPMRSFDRRRVQNMLPPSIVYRFFRKIRRVIAQVLGKR